MSAMADTADRNTKMPDRASAAQAQAQKDDDVTARFLNEAGLGSTPIDPASLEALRSLVTPKRDHHVHSRTGTRTVESKIETPSLASENRMDPKIKMTPQDQSGDAPVSVVRALGLSRVNSDLTQPNPSQTPIVAGQSATCRPIMRTGTLDLEDAATDASVAGSTRVSLSQMAADATPTERIILDQLEMQTALLLDMQRRIDQLSEVVGQQPHPQLKTSTATTTPSAPGRPRDPVMPPQPQVAGPDIHLAPQHQPDADLAREDAPAPLTRFFNFLLSLPAIVRSSRMAQIFRVFWTLHRRQLGRMDGGFWIKLVVMVALIMAKLNSTKNRRKQRNLPMQQLQFYVAGVVITLGFLIQSGYVKFLYNFFVEEHYHDRIWNGEVINLDAIPQAPVLRNNRGPDRQNVNAAEGGDGNNDDPQGHQPQPRGLLQGGIPPARMAAANGNVGLVDAVADVLYLFLSFLLSIFPMWKPQGPPRAERIQQLAEIENEEIVHEPELVDDQDEVNDEVNEEEKDDDDIYGED